MAMTLSRVLPAAGCSAAAGGGTTGWAGGGGGAAFCGSLPPLLDSTADPKLQYKREEKVRVEVELVHYM